MRPGTIKGEGQGAPPFGRSPEKHQFTKHTNHRPCRRGSSRSNCSYGLCLQGVGPRYGSYGSSPTSGRQPGPAWEKSETANVPPDPRLADHKRPQPQTSRSSRHKGTRLRGALACMPSKAGFDGVVACMHSGAGHARYPSLLSEKSETKRTDGYGRSIRMYVVRQVQTKMDRH